MSGLLGELEIARRALQAQQSALTVISHNIANANTPGYTRQEALLGATDPMDFFPGQVGTGVAAEQIRRLRDSLTDVQVRHQSGNMGSWNVREGVLRDLQAVFKEPSDNGLNAAMSRFFNAYQDLANHPEEPSFKTAVMAQAQSLVDTFHGMSGALQDVADKVTSRINGDVAQVNQYTSQLAQLNQQIVNAESSGEKANDLRDRRDTILDQLSQLVDVSYDEHAAGAVTVRVGGLNLVEGNSSRALTGAATVGGRVMLQSQDGSSVPASRGELAALEELHDTTLPGYQSQLDSLASGLIGQVNGIQGNGPRGTLVFSGSSAATIGLDPAAAADPSLLDAGLTSAAGDNSLALKLAGLRDSLVMNGGTTTFQSYYNGLVGTVGGAAAQAIDLNQNHTLLLQQLQNQRDSVSGVNMEDEMTHLLSAQKSFQAATQLVTTVDTLMTTVLAMVH